MSTVRGVRLPLTPGRSGNNGGGPTGPRDGTTRYLCAAAQLDQEFTDGAIGEYLVERVRAVPPSPGVDAAAVLREAVAARTRRRIRDGVLLGLLVLLAFVSPTTVIVWFVMALLGLSAVGAAQGHRRVVGLIIIGVLLVAVVVLLPSLLGVLSVLSLSYRYGISTGISWGWLVVGTGLVIAILGVLLADAIAVHTLVTERFRRETFVADHRRAAPSWERWIRGLGHQKFAAALHRVAAADAAGHSVTGDADVVVHRGVSPFVGAGKAYRPQTLALPLDPADDGRVPDRIRVADLHAHVASAMNGLRTTSSLSPERRLEHLDKSEQVLVPADRLVANRAYEPLLLPDLERPPLAHLPPATARQLAEWPREWARYYRCYRVESWERELTTSCYFYAGTDQNMLYLEWTHCVLPPIQHRFRSIDHTVEAGSGPVGAAFAELLMLPATVLRRFRSVVHRFVPIHQRYGEVVPDRYGAEHSLRELAADAEVQTYFQSVDRIRYVKIIDATLFRAVGDFLAQHGYSDVEFQKFASATITNNTVNVTGGTHVGGTVGAGTVTGGGNASTGAVRGAE